MKGGREGRSIGAYELATAVEQLGAGEILLNCIDCDGSNNLIFFFNLCVMEFILFCFHTSNTCDSLCV